MKRHTHSHRLDILQTRIQAVQSAANKLSKPDEYGTPFTFIQCSLLLNLLLELDEAQEQIHSILIDQQENLLKVSRQQDGVIHA
jgi:hypothetical protein